jgi:hypothetical protein
MFAGTAKRHQAGAARGVAIAGRQPAAIDSTPPREMTRAGLEPATTCPSVSILTFLRSQLSELALDERANLGDPVVGLQLIHRVDRVA